MLVTDNPVAERLAKQVTMSWSSGCLSVAWWNLRAYRGLQWIVGSKKGPGPAVSELRRPEHTKLSDGHHHDMRQANVLSCQW